MHDKRIINWRTQKKPFFHVSAHLTLTTNVPTVSATTVLCMAFFAEDDGGIGGMEGGGIDGNPPGIVELESSSSGDKSVFGGDGAGDIVRVGNAGVGGIIKCKGGEWCSGDNGGEYIGETADGDGVALDGDGVLSSLLGG